MTRMIPAQSRGRVTDRRVTECPDSGSESPMRFEISFPSNRSFGNVKAFNFKKLKLSLTEPQCGPGPRPPLEAATVQSVPGSTVCPAVAACPGLPGAAGGAGPGPTRTVPVCLTVKLSPGP